MPYNQTPSEYFGWYFRYNTRTTFSHFSNAGLDLFASAADSNPNAFLDLTNVMPSMSGGFRRRWGISSVITNPYATVINPVRAFPYNVAQDQTEAGSSALNAVLFTDGTSMQVLTDSGTTFGISSIAVPFPAGGSAAGSYALTSREYLYMTNGAGNIIRTGIRHFDTTAQSSVIKGQLNIAAPVFTSWGFEAPDLSNTVVRDGTLVKAGFSITGYGTGSNYTSPTVTINDPTGTGAVVTAQLSNGHISGFSIQNPGANYTSPTVSISDASGTGAQAIAYADLNPNSTSHGQIVAVLPAGPISLAGGRTYTAAFMNSVTGHVSDIATATVTTATNQAIPEGTDAILSTPPSTLTPGWTAIDLSMTFGSPTWITGIGSPFAIDSQIDNLLLLATSDGGSIDTLYEVTQVARGSWTEFSGFDIIGGLHHNYDYFTVSVTDTTPDGFSVMYTSGSTLLTNDVYASTDGLGNEFGIVGNTPPPTPLLYPILHQGRIFGTDGETVFFSKSIDEVTTASGLIAAKWEEAWPGDNQLPIALDNEIITALKSDGTNLHIGTTRAIYTCVGTDPSNFSVGANQFAQTGVLSNDLWTVVYSQGQPAGFMWVTPDYKVMWSDFNTYTDIGTPIYPLLQQWDTTFTNAAKMLAFTQGPYNFVVLTYKRTNSAAAEFLIYETVLKKWYRWEFGSPNSFLQPAETGPLCSFVYQHPSTGNRYLYFFTLNTGVTQSSRVYSAPPAVQSGYTLNLYRFDPSALVDLGSTGIGWNVQTAWQDLGDSQVIKVLNEIDILSDETNLEATVYGAYSQGDLDSPFTVASGATTTTVLGNIKFPLAAYPSKARFYSFRFFSNIPNTNSTNEVLSGFAVEHCVIARI